MTLRSCLGALLAALAVSPAWAFDPASCSATVKGDAGIVTATQVMGLLSHRVTERRVVWSPPMVQSQGKDPRLHLTFDPAKDGALGGLATVGWPGVTAWRDGVQMVEEAAIQVTFPDGAKLRVDSFGDNRTRELRALTEAVRDASPSRLTLERLDPAGRITSRHVYELAGVRQRDAAARLAVANSADLVRAYQSARRSKWTTIRPPSPDAQLSSARCLHVTLL